MLVAARVHVRARLPRPARAAASTSGRARWSAGSSSTSPHAATSPTRSRRLRRRDDRPLRADVRGGLALDGPDQGRIGRGGEGGRATSSTSSPRARRCAEPARAARGRCPFHEERTPSFSVNADDKLFYCFGCGKGGDSITFVRETEQLDFAEAIEWLAERFNVPLEYEESSPQAEEERRRRERLLALLEQAAAFYERHLWESQAGGPARDYLAGRGLGEEVCREFRLGLSPGGTTRSPRKAREKGFTRGRAPRRRARATARGNDYFRGA